MGNFMAIMSTPMNSKTMTKVYPGTGETEGDKILEAIIKNYVYVLIGSGLAYLVLNFSGKRYFGMLSYNITYTIRKQLYSNILTKEMGYFDFP